MKKKFTLVELLICIAIVGILGGIIFGATGCDVMEKSADQDMSDKTAKSLREANSQIGMPAIKNFQERKLAKMIFELRDKENLICHAYLVNQMNGQIGQYLGQCIGFGLPYSVQYTNPSKITRMHVGGSYITIPQADPNGLFMPQGLSATWLMLINPETGKPKPVYIEPQIIVSPFKLK